MSKARLAEFWNVDVLRERQQGLTRCHGKTAPALSTASGFSTSREDQCWETFIPSGWGRLLPRPLPHHLGYGVCAGLEASGRTWNLSGVV